MLARKGALPLEGGKVSADQQSVCISSASILSRTEKFLEKLVSSRPIEPIRAAGDLSPRRTAFRIGRSTVADVMEGDGEYSGSSTGIYSKTGLLNCFLR